MKLIYCSYATLDQDSEPAWLEALLKDPFVEREGWALYRPMLGFMENVESLHVLAALNRPMRHDKRLLEGLKLDPQVFDGLPVVRDRMIRADSGPYLDVSFKRLYALLRADVVVADLDRPDHGDKMNEILYAYLVGVPVIGVAQRFILSPATLKSVSSVVFPQSSGDIVRQILAFEHRTTAALKHCYQPATDTKVEELAARMKRMAEEQKAGKPEQVEQPDGRNESTD